MTTCQIGVSAEIMMINNTLATAVNKKPIGKIFLTPNLSDSMPMMGDNNAFIALPGSKANPATAALTSKDVRIYRGSKMAEERIKNMPMNNSTTPNVNIGYLNTRKLIIGCFILNCLTANNDRETKPTTNGRYTYADVKDFSAIVLKL